MIPYTLKKSRRTRRINITVKNSGEVIVTMPFFALESTAEKFVIQKAAWIQSAQEKMKKQFENKIILKKDKKDYLEHKDQALAFVLQKIEYFNNYYDFDYQNVSIKNQSTRWGSCSKKGNLNFNYALIHLPQALADYIVVHELCHLKEFNHGKGFWNLVAETIPDYKEIRNELKKKYIHVS